MDSDSNYPVNQVYIESNTGAIVTGGSFQHLSPGEINSFSPTIGRQGTIITLEGFSLTGYGSAIVNVTVAGYPVLSDEYLTVNNDTRLIIQVGPAPNGTSGPIRLTTDTGVIIESNSTFTYTGHGIINSISPSVGAEGIGILIQGTYLVIGSLVNVTIGGSPVMRIVTSSINQVSVIAGPAPDDTNISSLPIRITSQDGSYVEGSSFAYQNISAVVTGRNSGQYGTVITIQVPFNVSAVNIGDQQATILSSTANSVTVTVPRATRHGQYVTDVTVHSSQHIVARIRNGFTYLPEGIILNVSPQFGQKGTIVVIEGERLLGGGDTVSSVVFSGINTNVLNYTDSFINVTLSDNLPNSFTGQYPYTTDVTVISNTGSIVTRLGGFNFIRPGVINSLSPPMGRYGTVVSIIGNNLLQNDLTIQYVTVVGIEATILGTPNNTHIQVQLMPGSMDTGPVIITLDSGAEISSNNLQFNYISPGAINSISPSIGTVGTVITINGSNLRGGGNRTDIVTVGGSIATVLTDGDTQLIVRASQGESGAVVIVSNTGAIVSSGNDTWTYKPIGYINTTVPLSGQQGVIVNITGVNLTGESSIVRVTLAGVPATIISVNNSLVQVIAGYSNQSAVGPILLEQDTGPVIISTLEWSYYEVILESATPSRGINGTYVTLYGTNIKGEPNTTHTVSSVSIGTVLAYDIRVISSDVIRVRAGDLSLASGPLTITVNSSSGAYISLPFYWSYNEPGHVTSIYPSLAPPGSNITIYGYSLVPDNTTSVTVVTGNTVSYGANVINSSVIQFRVGVYTGYDTPNISLPLTITANDGSSLTTPTPFFTFQEVVAMVTSISPSAGGEGSPVTIEGIDLINITIKSIYLVGVPAVINSLSSNLITVTAGPGNDIKGQLIIETDDGLLYGGNEWIYLPSLDATYVSPNEGRNGTLITIDISMIPVNYTVQSVTIGGNEAIINSLTNNTVTVRVSDNSTLDTTTVISFQDNIELIIPNSFTPLNPLTITNISTLVGYHGTVVYINGTEFGGVQSVTLTGMNATIITRTDTWISLRINSSYSSGPVSGPIVMIGQDGSVFTSNFNFTYLQVSINTVSPSNGQYGTVISIQGTGLLAGGNTVSAMTLGGIAIGSILTVSDNVITVTAGHGNESMTPLDIIYIVDTGAEVTIATVWSYISPGFITGVSPSSGRRGTVVMVTGVGMLGGGNYISSVSLSGVISTQVLISNNEFIQVIASNSSSIMTGQVTVIANTGAIVTSNIITFQYLSPFNISSFTPSFGQYGTQLTINGSQLFTVAIRTVLLNNVPANIITANQSMITVRAGPPSFIGSSQGSIQIISQDGSIAESETNFTYLTSGSIYSVSPKQGVKGTTVIIRGEGLRGGGSIVTSASLADVPATIVSENDTTVQLIATSPHDSRQFTGRVLLLANTGALGIRLNEWTYIEQGIIESLTPSSGQYGTYVTIIGQRLTGGGTSINQVIIGNITSLDVISSNDTHVIFRAGKPVTSDSYNETTIDLISNDNGIVTSSNMTWSYREESQVINISPINGTGVSIVNITGERLLGGGNDTVSVILAGINVRDILIATDTFIQVEAGFNPNGQPIDGDVIIESDSGALTVVYDGWSYVSECPIGQHGNSTDTCAPCHPECDHCFGPTQHDCYSCRKFIIVQNNECVPSCPSVSTIDKQCVDNCLSNQYESISTLDSQRYCINCSTLCNPYNGCTGPYPSQCGSCDVYSDRGGVCVNQCSIGTYISNKTCLPCSEQCLLSDNCTGPEPSQCNTCLNVSISINTSHEECIPTCPIDHYIDRVNHCRSCHSLCIGGCHGPSNFDCVECSNTSTVHDNGTIECVSTCNQQQGINNMFRDYITGQCMPCHEYCSLEAGCTGPTASDCTLCSNFTSGSNLEMDQFMPKYEDNCVLACPNNSYYVDVRNGNCELCHFSCSIGCTGPNDIDCIIEPTDTPTMSQEMIGAFSAGVGTIILVILIIVIILIIFTLITVILIVKLRNGKGNYNPTRDESTVSPIEFAQREISETNLQLRPLPPQPYIPKKRSRGISYTNVDVSKINPSYSEFTSGSIELHEEDETIGVSRNVSPSPGLDESTGLLAESHPPPSRPPRAHPPVPPTSTSNEYILDDETDNGEVYTDMEDTLCLSTQDEYNHVIDVISPLPVFGIPNEDDDPQGLYEETDSAMNTNKIHPLIQGHTDRPPVPPRLRNSVSLEAPPARPPPPSTGNTGTAGQHDDFSEEYYEEMQPNPPIVPRQKKH